MLLNFRCVVCPSFKAVPTSLSPFKKGSLSDPKNYRHLTLLNQDAKLDPKASDYCLNQVLPSSLDVDQCGMCLAVTSGTLVGKFRI